MKLKKWSLLLGVTIQDVLNVPNAQDPWISHPAMLDRMKKTSIAPNAIKKILQISPNAADLGKIVYRLFFLRLMAQFFTKIYTNCFVSS